MSLEQKINYQLNKYPRVKKYIKRAYQRTMYAISPKIKSEGDITRISPDDPNHEYFFGYYDKSPWDITDRYMLCMRANDTWSDVSPKEPADILLIDTSLPDGDKKRVKKIATTHSWNVQQSCMLQWLGPDFSSRVLYNDFRAGKYVSVILTLATGEEKAIPAPVYSVSADGKFALTLDFSRLYNLRPGYGYYNVPEKTKGVALPDTTAVWTVNLETGEVKPLLKYTDFAYFQPRKEMLEEGSVHKVNHLMISPNGKRFMVLYRWFVGERKYTRLITCNVDGTDMYLLSDDDMVSHCFWRNDSQILAFENKKKGGPGYYLMKDKSQKYIHRWPELSNDGHPSYSPERSLIVTDTYPSRSRIQELKIMNGKDNKDKSVRVIARVFSPFKYDNDTRCDLHPRWNHKGNVVCFDSVFDGHRGLYTVTVPQDFQQKVEERLQKKEEFKNRRLNKDHPKYSIITPLYNSFDLMGRYFKSLDNQTIKHFEVIIVDDCSSDGSYEKAKEYAEKSSLDISVYKSDSNKGPGNARNIGMDNAKGEYITFIDNDDWVDTEFLEKVDEIIEQEKVNCVIYDYYTTDGKEKKTQHSMYDVEGGRVSLTNCMTSVRNHTFGKFYKLTKCKGIRYPELRRCEDVAFVCRAIDACGSVYYLKEPLYYYYQRPTSLSNNTNLDESDMIKAFDILEKTLGDRYPNELKEKSVADLLYGCTLMMCKSGKSDKEIKAYIDRYENKYPEWWTYSSVNRLGKAKKFFLDAAKYRNVFAMKQMAALHSKIIGGGTKRSHH